MKNSGFKRPAYVRSAPSQPQRISGGRVVRCEFAMLVSTPKDVPIRSEAYRRLVAALPCIKCGIQGYSQAAHVPPEGKGTKQEDREIFALCCTRPSINGCHADFDQYRLFPRVLAMPMARYWAFETRRQVIQSGTWPKGLALFNESPLNADTPRLLGAHESKS